MQPQENVRSIARAPSNLGQTGSISNAKQ